MKKLFTLSVLLLILGTKTYAATPMYVVGKPCGESYISSLETCHITPQVDTVMHEHGPEDDVVPQGAMKNTYYVLALKLPGYGKVSRSEFSVVLNEKNLSVFPGSAKAMLDDQPITLNTPVIFYQATVYIPLRALRQIGCRDNADKYSSTSALEIVCGKERLYDVDVKIWR